MVKAIDLGGRMVSLQSNAGTALIYKRLFKSDLIKEIANANTDDERLGVIETLQQLAFVMAKQGEGLSLDKLLSLTEKDYIEWLMSFEPGTFEDVDTIMGLLALWRGQNVVTSESKN